MSSAALYSTGRSWKVLIIELSSASGSGVSVSCTSGRTAATYCRTSVLCLISTNSLVSSSSKSIWIGMFLRHQTFALLASLTATPLLALYSKGVMSFIDFTARAKACNLTYTLSLMRWKEERTACSTCHPRLRDDAWSNGRGIAIHR